MLDKILNALKSNPVRVRIYTVAALVVGYLLVRGVVSPTDKEFILSVLGIVLGTETARAGVSPVLPTDDAYADEHAVLSDEAE
ncbi:hypothetical protein OG474_09690 [Kribbella sp. NBC_01505]|uniref:hypothetical protein n=1 Tax=Kribbella sp. NBC_01505 TaxID=2903580 RepID=UPI00386B4527